MNIQIDDGTDLSPRKPTPTEYRGVRYRSRHEASFALLLDMQGNNFMYEPAEFRVNAWTPDFVTWRTAGHVPGLQFPRFTVIELKPVRPTLTYAQGLANNVQVLQQRFGKRLLIGRLVYGDLWKPETMMVVTFFESDKVCLGQQQLMIRPEEAAEIKSYRFDLENGGKLNDVT